jgi:hypothetical protein
MIYSAWGKDGIADTLAEGMELQEAARVADPGLVLIRTFEATDWNDAMRQYHEWQGWEPYRPME